MNNMVFTRRKVNVQEYESKTNEILWTCGCGSAYFHMIFSHLSNAFCDDLRKWERFW